MTSVVVVVVVAAASGSWAGLESGARAGARAVTERTVLVSVDLPGGGLPPPPLPPSPPLREGAVDFHL